MPAVRPIPPCGESAVCRHSVQRLRRRGCSGPAIALMLVAGARRRKRTRTSRQRSPVAPSLAVRQVRADRRPTSARAKHPAPQRLPAEISFRLDAALIPSSPVATGSSAQTGRAGNLQHAADKSSGCVRRPMRREPAARWAPGAQQGMERKGVPLSSSRAEARHRRWLSGCIDGGATTGRAEEAAGRRGERQRPPNARTLRDARATNFFINGRPEIVMAMQLARGRDPDATDGRSVPTRRGDRQRATAIAELGDCAKKNGSAFVDYAWIKPGSRHAGGRKIVLFGAGSALGMR